MSVTMNAHNPARAKAIRARRRELAKRQDTRRNVERNNKTLIATIKAVREEELVTEIVDMIMAGVSA